MCELTHDMAGERHGHGMGTDAMCESAFINWQHTADLQKYRYIKKAKN
jgi:hypothetical protein